MCKKRAISFLLAGLLAIMPIMNVQAEETTESGEATRHMPEDDMADENSGEDNEIISVEDANETLDAYDDEKTEWKEIYIDSVDDLQEFSRNCRLDTWSQNKKIYLTEDLNIAGSDFEPIPTFGGYFDGQGHTILYALILLYAEIRSDCESQRDGNCASRWRSNGGWRHCGRQQRHYHSQQL